MPPPTPIMPPTKPPATPKRMTRRMSISKSPDQELHGDDDEKQGEEVGDDPLRDALLERRSGDNAAHGRNADREPVDDVHVAVRPLPRGGKRRDDDDGGKAGPGRL